MAKGAAKEGTLGSLHSKVANVFIKVLDTYEARLDALDNITQEQLEDEILAQLFEDGAMPNPAMLAAITKFLKDNDINFDTDQIAELSNQERRLAERREKRGNVVTLTTLDAAGG